MKGGKSMYKYNKVTQQKKFHLLTLVLNQKLLIKQAARIVGINYSTAKTIMFFNRNLNKSYQFSFQNPQSPQDNRSSLTASYQQITSISNQDLNKNIQPLRITIVNTIGSEKALCRSIIHTKRLSGNYTKRMRERQDDLYDEYIDEAKVMEDRRTQRPLTRSQSYAVSYLSSYKLEGHQKRDFQSSGLPEISEE